MSQTCNPSSCCPRGRWTSRRPSAQRHVLRALLGAFSGALLFLGVSHSLPLSLELKLSTGALFTLVCAVSGALSSFVRGSLLLTFPMMLGSRGRSYILLQFLSLLYSGPVHNIQLNVEASALSLSCNLDLQLNHSRLLWRHTVLPLVSVAMEITDSTSQFTEETMNVSRTFQIFRQEVMRQYGAQPLDSEDNSTQQQMTASAMTQCDGVVQEAIMRCSQWFTLKWTQCMSTVSIPVLNHILCVPMKFTFLCDIMRAMTPWCTERLPVEGNVGALWEQLNRSLSLFHQEFRAQVVLEDKQQQDILDEPLLDQAFTNAVQDSFLRLRAGSEILMKVVKRERFMVLA